MPPAEASPPKALRGLWVAVAGVCACVLAACLTLLYLGAGHLIASGQTVATSSGELPASSDWVQLVVLSAPVGIGAALGHTAAAALAGGFTLLAPAWIALFGSLGWAFLRGGFESPASRSTIPFLVCGALFWLLALPALLGTVGNLLPSGRGGPTGLFGFTPRGGPAYATVNVVALILGVVLGRLLWAAAMGA